jgi:hypothetical protein
MVDLIEAQLNEFKKFLPVFMKKDAEMEALFDNDREPSKKETREFEKLKVDYIDFQNFFERYDGNYWGGELSVLDVVDMIKEEAGFPA